jgi:hypothetical protein
MSIPVQGEPRTTAPPTAGSPAQSSAPSTATVRSSAAVAVATAVSVVAVAAGPSAVAAPAGVLLAFVLPGAALTTALFHRRALTTAERVVLAPALSLALVVLSGLLLNAAGVHLDRGSWAAATAGVTAIALLATAVTIRSERSRTTEPAAAQPQASEPAAAQPRAAEPPHPAVAGGGVRLGRHLAPLVLAAVVLAGAGWYSYADSRDATARTVTALSVTRQVPAGTGKRAVDIAVTGLVAAYGPHTVVAKGQDGRPVLTRTIPPGNRSWTGTLTVSALERISVDLYRAGQPSSPYRTVLLSPQS